MLIRACKSAVSSCVCYLLQALLVSLESLFDKIYLCHVVAEGPMNKFPTSVVAFACKDVEKHALASVVMCVYVRVTEDGLLEQLPVDTADRILCLQLHMHSAIESYCLNNYSLKIC